MLLTGSILLLFGLAALLTPIPGSTLAITVGAGLLICFSETVSNYIKRWRVKFSRFNRTVVWLENKMGPGLSRSLRMTRPEEPRLNAEQHRYAKAGEKDK